MRWIPFCRLFNHFLLNLEAVSHGALGVSIEKILVAFLQKNELERRVSFKA